MKVTLEMVGNRSYRARFVMCGKFKTIGLNTRDKTEAEKLRVKIEEKLKKECPELFEIKPLNKLDKMIKKYKECKPKIESNKGKPRINRNKEIEEIVKRNVKELNYTFDNKNFNDCNILKVKINNIGYSCSIRGANVIWKWHSKKLNSVWINDISVYDIKRIGIIVKDFINEFK